MSFWESGAILASTGGPRSFDDSLFPHIIREALLEHIRLPPKIYPSKSVLELVHQSRLVIDISPSLDRILVGSVDYRFSCLHIAVEHLY